MWGVRAESLCIQTTQFDVTAADDEGDDRLQRTRRRAPTLGRR
jgi:hypothetical protein